MATSNNRMTNSAIQASRSNRSTQGLSSDRQSSESKLLTALLGNSRKDLTYQGNIAALTKKSETTLTQMLTAIKSIVSSSSRKSSSDVVTTKPSTDKTNIDVTVSVDNGTPAADLTPEIHTIDTATIVDAIKDAATVDNSDKLSASTSEIVSAIKDAATVDNSDKLSTSTSEIVSAIKESAPEVTTITSDEIIKIIQSSLSSSSLDADSSKVIEVTDNTSDDSAPVVNTTEIAEAIRESLSSIPVPESVDLSVVVNAIKSLESDDGTIPSTLTVADIASAVKSALSSAPAPTTVIDTKDIANAVTSASAASDVATANAVSTVKSAVPESVPAPVVNPTPSTDDGAFAKDSSAEASSIDKLIGATTNASSSFIGAIKSFFTRKSKPTEETKKPKGEVFTEKESSKPDSVELSLPDDIMNDSPSAAEQKFIADSTASANRTRAHQDHQKATSIKHTGLFTSMKSLLSTMVGQMKSMETGEFDKSNEDQLSDGSNIDEVFADKSAVEQSMMDKLIGVLKGRNPNAPDSVNAEVKGLQATMKSFNMMSIILELVKKLVGSMADSMNRYAQVFEKTLPQMVSTMNMTQQQYKDMILGTNQIIMSAGSLTAGFLADISDASATMTILANNHLMTNISMIDLIEESYTKLSSKGITGSNISELAIYDQLFELIAYGFDLTSQNNLDAIRLYGNQTAIMSSASYMSIRNQLNSLFGDTQYLLNGIYSNTVSLSQTAFNAYTDNRRRIESEHAFQKTLAIMYESGVSNQTIENWSTALTSLMAGDLNALSGDAGASLLLALKNSGVEIANVVSGAMTGSDIKKMLVSMLESARDAVDGNYNMIYKNAVANILGTDVTTLSAGRLEEAIEMMNFTQEEDAAALLKVLNDSVSKAGESLTMEQKMKNSVDNIAVNMTTGFVSLGSGIIGTLTSLGSAILVGMTALALSNMSVMGNNVGAPIGTALIATTAVVGIVATIASAVSGMASMTKQFQTSNEKLGLNMALEEQGMDTIDYDKLASTLNDSSSSAESSKDAGEESKSQASAAEKDAKESEAAKKDYAEEIYLLLVNRLITSDNTIRVHVNNQTAQKDYSNDLDTIKTRLSTINNSIVSGFTSFSMSSAITPSSGVGVSLDPSAIGGGI